MGKGLEETIKIEGSGVDTPSAALSFLVCSDSKGQAQHSGCQLPPEPKGWAQSLLKAFSNLIFHPSVRQRRQGTGPTSWAGRGKGRVGWEESQKESKQKKIRGLPRELIQVSLSLLNDSEGGK